MLDAKKKYKYIDDEISKLLEYNKHYILTMDGLKQAKEYYDELKYTSERKMCELENKLSRDISTRMRNILIEELAYWEERNNCAIVLSNEYAEFIRIHNDAIQTYTGFAEYLECYQDWIRDEIYLKDYYNDIIYYIGDEEYEYSTNIRIDD